MKYDVNELTEVIIENESIYPGDRIDISRIEDISKKYSISPAVLCMSILGITETAYRGLYSENSNAKVCIVMKNKIPSVISEFKSIVLDILKNEGIIEATSVDYFFLNSLAKKHKINDRVFIVDVLGISSYVYRGIKNDKTKKTRLLCTDKKESGDLEFALRIVKDCKLKIGQKIDYDVFSLLLAKYEISEEELSSCLGITKSCLYHMRSDHKKKAIILKKIDTAYYEEIKQRIITEFNIKCNGLINTSNLLSMADEYCLEPKILATKVLGITENQYYNLIYIKTTKAKVLKTKIMCDTEIVKCVNLFKDEEICEGSKVDYEKLEYLSSKYQLSGKEVATVLGLSSSAYGFIKRERNYSAVVRDPIKLKKIAAIKALIPANTYVDCNAINSICSVNDITTADFINYLVKGARNEEYDKTGFYHEKIARNEPIWIGKKHPLSHHFVDENYERLLKLFKIAAYRTKKGDNKLSTEDYASSIFETIYSTSGDLENNFKDQEFFIILYRRAVSVMHILLCNERKKHVKVVDRTKVNNEYYDTKYLKSESSLNNVCERGGDSMSELVGLVDFGYSEAEAISIMLKKNNITLEELREQIHVNKADTLLCKKKTM